VDFFDEAKAYHVIFSSDLSPDSGNVFLKYNTRLVLVTIMYLRLPGIQFRKYNICIPI